MNHVAGTDATAASAHPAKLPRQPARTRSATPMRRRARPPYATISFRLGDGHGAPGTAHRPSRLNRPMKIATVPTTAAMVPAFIALTGSPSQRGRTRRAPAGSGVALAAATEEPEVELALRAMEEAI